MTRCAVEQLRQYARSPRLSTPSPRQRYRCRQRSSPPIPEINGSLAAGATSARPPQVRAFCFYQCLVKEQPASEQTTTAIAAGNELLPAFLADYNARFGKQPRNSKNPAMISLTSSPGAKSGRFPTA